ncbi:hypothetical protein CY35_04G006400 [Sphagnum magellanicum]|nr:hypothetical protein CY35_04G006400 [Sphagnum magellanicum]
MGMIKPFSCFSFCILLLFFLAFVLLPGSDVTVKADEEVEVLAEEKEEEKVIEDNATQFVNDAIAVNRVVVFSKSYCPYCQRAKALFKQLNEEPYIVELDLREDGAAIHQALQKLVERRTVPQVFVNGVHVGGADDTVAAQHSGRLKKLLKSRQAKSIPVDRSHDSEL